MRQKFPIPNPPVHRNEPIPAGLIRSPIINDSSFPIFDSWAPNNESQPDFFCLIITPKTI